MFIGHFAVGFAAKSLKSKPSLGTYFLAAQFPDLLWPTFLLLNIEKSEISQIAANPIPLSFTHYPISHSLLTVIGWGVLFALVYTLLKKNKNAAIILGVCVVSHWLLDFFVHIPDLPLYPGNSPLFGLGMWRLKTAVLVVEVLMLATGVFLYLKASRTKSRKGSYATLAFVFILLVVHLLNVFGPPPPSMKAVAWAGQLQWLFVLWGYLIDRGKSKTHKEKNISKAEQPIAV
ncbi:MAG TPA: metal-dependent hydrolase [Flavisolibacter sp.]|nr:metal-dependent hydrolase [Flavisolibacter sp.]